MSNKSKNQLINFVRAVMSGEHIDDYLTEDFEQEMTTLERIRATPLPNDEDDTDTTAEVDNDGTVHISFIGSVAGKRINMVDSLWDLPEDFRCAWEQNPRSGSIEVYSRTNPDGTITVAVGVRAYGIDWCECVMVSEETFTQITNSLRD